MNSLQQKIRTLAHKLAPWLPKRWRLAILTRAHLLTGWDHEAKQLARIGPNRGLAIDIGANQGFYTYCLARLYDQVIAFEPNPQASQTIVDAQFHNVDLINACLSSRNGTAPLYVPHVANMPLTGWASLDKENCPNAEDVNTLESTLRTLDSFNFEDVGFIKIDVEGHELDVIRGASKTIQREMPHLLVEIRPAFLSTIEQLLASWGYEQLSLVDLTGQPTSQGNYIYRPKA